ncbi:MAG TPA: hypothetical protein VG895_05785 [Patescibacteria group bacterium]|nr:hypothetical protein [Gammaproteobacteria bacterium]HWA52525.1 hypothetical protein [Patescibacteria group bacterium]
MRLFSESTPSNKPQPTTKAKFEKKPISSEITFEFLDNPEHPEETLGTAIELDGRYLEPPFEQKASKIFPKLPFQAIIVYLDIISLINLGKTQKSMFPYFLSPQCLFAFNQVNRMTVLSYSAAYIKLKDYIEKNYCSLITDEKQGEIETGKLALYQTGNANAFRHSRSGETGKKRLNEFLQDIFKMQHMPQAQKEGCVILLQYVESVIIAKQGDRFPQMLADAVTDGLFIVSPTEPRSNTQILEGERAKHAGHAIARITKTANAHSRSGLKKLQDVGDAIVEGLDRMSSASTSSDITWIPFP